MSYVDRLGKVKLQIVDIRDDLKSSSKVIIRCGCGSETTVTLRSIVRKWEGKAKYLCKSCHVKTYINDDKRVKKFKKSFSKIAKTEDHKKKCSNAGKILWKDKDLKEKHSQVMIERNKIDHRLREGRNKALETLQNKNWFINHMNRMREKAHDILRYKCENDKEYRTKLKKRLNDAWRDPSVREKHRNSTSKVSKNRWKNKEHREKMVKLAIDLWKNKEYREKTENAIRKFVIDPEYRKKLSKSSKKIWKNKTYRSRMLSILDKARHDQSKVSSLALTFYSILDDLGVKYYREYNNKPDDPQCKIAEYSFDCVIPRENNKDLLIDVNGNWPHSLEDTIRRDKAKATYIERYHSNEYELKYVWENDLSCKNKVVELIRYWLGITKLELVDFNFKDIAIRSCPASDYKLLLAKYHYLPNAGRGGISYGAYLNDELIATCVFSSLIRQNIALPKGYNKNNARELSRLCIHPRYQKKNFASWFISKCIKKLDPKYKLVISYADTTFNHIGIIYKACGFKQDRIVKPDYWYAKEDGWVMHKRTLYGKAVNMKMKENQFAEFYGYKKIYGKEKLRFVYIR